MMLNTQKKLLYLPSDYDNNFALKLNLTAWIIIAYIMRHFVVYIASVSNRKDRFGLLNMLYPDHTWALIGAIASIPTIVLLIAWVKRTPHAGRIIRHIWQLGRGLLTASLLLNIAALFAPWQINAKLSNIAIAQLGICGILLYVLWRSSRIRDTFADFPTVSTPTTTEPSTT